MVPSVSCECGVEEQTADHASNVESINLPMDYTA